MQVMDTVMDYVVEQATKNNVRNLQFERDILFSLHREYLSMEQGVLNCIHSDINNVLTMQITMNSIIARIKSYNSAVSLIVYNKFAQYYKMAYTQTDDLIEIGKTMNAKLNDNIHEFKQTNDQYTAEEINFIRSHALELSSAYSADKIEKIRSAIADLMLRGKGSYNDVRSAIEKILSVNASKSEEIAQTELSRAYNYGQMRRFNEYQQENPDHPMKKYWYGFDDDVTCAQCRDHIGEEYDIDDNKYTLPLHPRCRCIWLPSIDGWHKTPFANDSARIGVVSMYPREHAINKINNRLGITYGNFINQDALNYYLSGDRSSDTMNAIKDGRRNAINNMNTSLGIRSDTSNTEHMNDFNTQLKFWKKVISTAVVDSDGKTLDTAYDNIQSLINLSWSKDQIDKWNNLLKQIK